jgi:hypothetical protein
LNTLIQTQDPDSLNEDERRTIAYFVATQVVRTKEMRETLKEYFQHMRDTIRIFSPRDELLNSLYTYVASEPGIKQLHVDMIKSEVPTIAGRLQEWKWILMRNKTTIPFWTSDHPVVVYSPFTHMPRPRLGLFGIGAQIYFPLDPEKTLCICDFSHYIYEKSCYEITKDVNVILENELQVKWSNRYIFSSTNDFGLAERLFKDYPEEMLPDKKRFRMFVSRNPDD